jgi:hypothetical protein
VLRQSLCGPCGKGRRFDGVRDLHHEARRLQSLFAGRRRLPNGTTTIQSKAVSTVRLGGMSQATLSKHHLLRVGRVIPRVGPEPTR